MNKNSILHEYDPAMFLDNNEIIIEYLDLAKQESEDAFLEALATVARAKGMTDLAQKTGLNRESLYKSLKKGAKPRYETIEKILRGLGLKNKLVYVE
jgi:probable addiction module antidote protein